MYLTPRETRETGRDYALRTIKDNIIRLDLEPGSMLSENELASEMGLSRTPVREALIELAKVKIVEVFPQRGSAVALIDYAMVEEARFMRKVLECAVVELACATASGEDILRLEENVSLQKFYRQSNSSDMLLKLDNQFHGMLFEIANKKQVYALMSTLCIHFDRVRNMALYTVKEDRTLEDHQIIAEAVKERDAQSARERMELHLTRYRVDEKAIREKYPRYFKG